jgi:four helix bundle protein
MLPLCGFAKGVGMASGSTHRELRAWQEAMTLVEVLYRESQAFPKQEMFGLAAQIRRAAVSIPSNIAEGAARNTPGELCQFLGIACGSLAELETQVELCVRLGYLSSECETVHQLDRVGPLVVALRRSLR